MRSSTKMSIASLALLALFFITLIPTDAVFSSKNLEPELASSRSYLYAPYKNVGVKVQQGYVSHFAYYSNKHKGCGYYYGAIWKSVGYTPREKKDGVYCSHDGIDYILGEPQSNSTKWKPFDVLATIKAKVICGYSSVWGYYITQEQVYSTDTIKVRYVHLAKPTTALGKLCGKVVERGTKIGVASDTGSAKGTGIHLHLDVWRNGVRIDPYGIRNNWKYYPPYKAVNWDKLTHVWFIENGRVKIFTRTPTPTRTPVKTLTPTVTPTLTVIFTQTLTATGFVPSNTPTLTQTLTSTATETLTATSSSTPEPLTATPTSTSTPTPAPIILQPVLHYPGYPTSGSASTCVNGNKWLNIPGGYEDDAYLTLNVNTSTDTHTAYWYPDFVAAGQYKVEVFIANHQSITWSCNSSQISDDTSVAKYQVWHRDGKSTITVNQLPIANAWAIVGTFNFDPGQQYNEYVKLANVTTDANLSHFLSVSAIRFTYIGP